MLTLYGLLLLMLILALALLSLPFMKHRFENFKIFFILMLLMTLFTFALYQFSGNKSALYLWLTHGKEHYQLLEKFDQLGGVDGAIARVKNKLNVTPNDAQGWFILGKLYLSKQDDSDALDAFTKAHELEPNDTQINKFYDSLKK